MLTQVKPIPIGDAVWPAPNYINPKSRVGELLGVHIGMTVAALVIVFIRVMVRIKLVKAAGMDDYLIITASVLALVSTTVMCLGTSPREFTGPMGTRLTIVIAETSGGAGLHIWDVKIDNNFAKTLQVIHGLPSYPGSNHANLEKYSFASQILYMPIVQTVKMSVLMFYLRLSPDRKFRILVFTVMSMCSILAVSWVLVVLFGCNPIPKSWSFWMVGTCYDHTSFYRATGIINIILDFVLFLLPYQVLKKLQIAHKQKIALWVLLSVGILVLITSVIRITLYFGGKWTLSYTDPTYWEVDTQVILSLTRLL